MSYRGRASSRPLALALTALMTFIAACGGTPATSSPTPTAAASASAAGKSLDVLIADAKKEGRLTLYSGDTEDVLKFEANLFNIKYGIQVDYVRALTDPLIARIAAEYDSGVNAADFFHIGGEAVFSSRSQLFMPLSRANVPDWDAYPEVGRGPNHFIMRDAPAVVTYNTRLVPTDKVPKTWNDLLDPYWKGHILFVDPNAAPSYFAWAQDMIDLYGISYLEKIRAQELKIAASGVPASQQVAAGTAWITFPSRPVHSAPLRAQGAPINYQVIDGANGGPIIGAVMAKAPHPNAALLFAHYMMSREFQGEFCKTNEVMAIWNIDGKNPASQVPGCMKSGPNWKLAKQALTDAQRATILRTLGL
jgi:iron(III) transport system substrate-binding protein